MTLLTPQMLKVLKPADNDRRWYEIQDDGVRCEGTLCHLRIRVGGPRDGKPPRKSWSLYYRPNRPGAKRRNKTFGHFPETSLKQARDLAMTWGRDCQEGIDPFAKGRRARETSYRFEHQAREYFDYISSPEDPKTDGPVPRILNWRHRQRLVEAHVLSQWADLDVREITTEMALDLIAEVRYRPEGRETTVTADKLRSALRMMFKHWKDRRIVKINPIRAIECFRENRTRDIYLEPDEIRRLWPFLESEILTGTLARAIRASAFQLALLEGMRFGEVVTSRWNEVDEEREWLTVPPHRFFKGQRIPGSNKPRRTLHAFVGSPFGRALFRRLESLRSETVVALQIEEPLEWIFPGTTSQRWIRPSGKEMVRYREATGLPELGWHVLRHTFATLAEGDLGLDRIDIGRAMNHAHETSDNGGERPRAPRVTGSYIHPSDARIRAKVKPVFEAWHAYLADLVKAPEILPGRAA